MTTQGLGSNGAGAEGEGSRGQPLGWAPPGGGRASGPGAQAEEDEPEQNPQEVGVGYAAQAVVGRAPSLSESGRHVGPSERGLTAEVWPLGWGRGGYYY